MGPKAMSHPLGGQQMHRKLIGAGVVVAMTTFALASVAARGQAPAPPAGQAPPPGGGAGGSGGRGGAPAQIDFATARKAVEAAEAAAVAGNAKVAIAIVDANGDLVYFRRMDGTAGVPVT